MKRATRECVGKAEEDYRTAELIERSREPLYDQLCFHCQQSAEKYLKALLEELGVAIDKTHDLEKLLTCLSRQHPPLRSLRRGLVFLTGLVTRNGGCLKVVYHHLRPLAHHFG
jgi:HEPN domain-containing protein